MIEVGIGILIGLGIIIVTLLIIIGSMWLIDKYGR